MRYRLNAEHLIGDVLYPAGTEIGDGTTIDFKELDAEGKPQWRPPSMHMEPLDEEARQAVLKHNKEMAAKGARPEVPVPPIAVKHGEAVPGQGPGGPKVQVPGQPPLAPKAETKPEAKPK